MAGKIFVNYRRDDCRAEAARVRDRLAQAFGAQNVFMDVDNLLVGQRFDKELEKALDQCDIFLAVMGPRWMATLYQRMQLGERDYVVEEVTAALRRNTIVIPVMIERTPLPRADQLPPGLAPLVLHQKHDVAHESFGRDVQALVDGIKAARKATGQKPVRRWRGAAAATLGVALIGTVLAFGPRVAGMLTPLSSGTSEPAVVANTPAPQSAEPVAAAVVPPPPASAPEETQKADQAELQKKIEEEAAAEKERQRVALLAAEEEAAKRAAAAEEAARKAAAAKPGPPFRDCSEACPEMVPLPAGEFMMGSKPEYVTPKHKVTFAKPFAIGKYEVTFAEWDVCVSEGGCQKSPSDEGWGRGRRPVINVNWYDVQQYLAWLSKRTGKIYRLPSEAEWEYAAKAGTATKYAFGEDILHSQAQFSETSGDAMQTVEVGRFLPNAWGLHDMHGNVWEWCADTSHDDYKGAPKDGVAWLGGDSSKHIQRGGSWNYWAVSSSYRTSDETGDSGYSVGFRVARSM